MKERPRKRPARATARPGDGLAVAWPWYSPVAFVLLALYLGGLAVAAAVAGAVRDGGVGPGAQRPVLAAAIGWVAVSSWGILAAFVNRTTVRLAGGDLTLTHGPLYWPGAKRFRAADIEDVTVAADTDATGDGEPVVTYRVRVRPAGTYARTLMAGFRDRAEADALRDQLLTALGRTGGGPG